MKVTGDKELDRKLKNLATKSEKKIVRAIDGAMMTVFLRGVRNAVPPQYKSIKKTLGRKVGKNKRKNINESKFGFGVGKRSKSEKQRDPQKGGVGISKENVHWFLLGSKKRKRKNKASTGKMPAIGEGWLKKGVKAVQSEAENKGQQVARTKLAEEARKP